MLLGAAFLWMILFYHNAPLLPRGAGFDAVYHLDYIQYVEDHLKLPSASEGWEMHQPPLYYGISALMLGAFALSPADDQALIVLRLMTMAIGIVHFIIVFGCVRLLFPNQKRKQTFGLILAAFLPAHLYLSHYPTNETLAATLVSAAIYLLLGILREEQAPMARYAQLGACLGSALLTKTSAILVVPCIGVGLAGRLIVKRQTGFRTWLRTLGVMTLVCAVICGWHYWRVWADIGNPLRGHPRWSYGSSWWQDDGYRTSSYYARFSKSLREPFFSGFYSFADGIYSTLWGDGLCGGATALKERPPWDYELMAVGYLFAVVPTLAILVGAIVALARFIRQPSADWLLLLGLAYSFAVAAVFISLVVPSYAQAKAFFGLLALVPLCAFGAIGWDWFASRGKVVAAVLWILLGMWAINSYVSLWISDRAHGHQIQPKAIHSLPQSVTARYAPHARLDNQARVC
jgi:hypothetical protein